MILAQYRPDVQRNHGGAGHVVQLRMFPSSAYSSIVRASALIVNVTTCESRSWSETVVEPYRGYLRLRMIVIDHQHPEC